MNTTIDNTTINGIDVQAQAGTIETIRKHRHLSGVEFHAQTR